MTLHKDQKNLLAPLEIAKFKPPNRVSSIKDTLPIRRAGGDCLCSECSRSYYDHPMIDNMLDYNQEPFLHMLCNGDVVKL